MGGLRIVPDCLVDDIIISEKSVLLLPGANTWNDPKYGSIIEKAGELFSLGGIVGAICGATVALANYGLLDKSSHTSNGVGFLEMFSPNYKGQSLYIDKPSVSENKLITASATGALLWTKQIIEELGVFQLDTLESCGMSILVRGDPQYFFSLMDTLPSQG